ncbi:MAG: hypothetical protein RIE31_06265 [Alphaproteobacteria bacterium]
MVRPPARVSRPTADATGVPSSRIPTAWIVLLVGLIGLLAIALPTAIVVGVGMAPSIVAFVADVERPRYRTYTIGLLNMAGTMPFVFDLWSGANTLATAVAIVGNVYAWLAMYGAAGIGWGLTVMMPGIAGVFFNAWAERRIVLDREEQVRLVQDWGPEVAEGDNGPTPRVRL